MTKNWQDVAIHPSSIEELEDEVAKLRVENAQYVEIINALAQRLNMLEKFLENRGKE